ncbi:MAG: FKBP-type peptidyl-prolyl cis-trans isomerase [Bacteroidota bacterium]|nr:FKBP-type peptidyl-prolyl cis-trans isomerase [Bacteroidota bacterium]
MKRAFTLVVVMISVCTLSFGQKKALPKPKTSPSEDTIQYSLGVYMMQQYFAKSGFAITNPVMFKKAIDDVLANRPLMVKPETTQDRLLAYQRTFQLEKGRRLEQLLFEKVKSDRNFTPLPSGVYYTVAKQGTGLRPSPKDTVILNVVCTLPDGTEVDNTSKTKQSYMTLAGEMIPGLKEVLYRMEEGAIVRAIIPASMAYGEVGTTNIPPNSAVIYDVALVSVKPAKL